MQEQVNQKVEGTQTFNPSVMSGVDPEFARFILSNDPLLQELEIRLLRLDWDPVKKSYFRKEGNVPICNEFAIKDFLAILGSISDKGVVLSNFSETMIFKRMIDLVDTFADLLTLKLDKYDIDPADVDLVRIILEQTAEAALRRAYKGGGIKSLSNSLERKEIITTPQRKGFFK